MNDFCMRAENHFQICNVQQMNQHNKFIFLLRWGSDSHSSQLLFRPRSVQSLHGSLLHYSHQHTRVLQQPEYEPNGAACSEQSGVSTVEFKQTYLGVHPLSTYIGFPKKNSHLILVTKSLQIMANDINFWSYIIPK